LYLDDDPMSVVTLAPPKLSSPQRSDEPFASPLFREVAARFDRDTRHVILELGVTSNGTLSLLQGKRCRILVVDAARALSELNEQPPEEKQLRRRIKTLLGDAGAEKIDTVLCWDLLNYFSLPMLSAFAQQLTRIMSAGGMVHAYIHSASAVMAQYPQRYSASGEEAVVRLEHDPQTRKTPRYSFRDLEKHTVGLRVERSMLLRNGIQEYLLRVDPSQA
jgi:hypothetical protein